jgi:hypothetical protein
MEDFEAELESLESNAKRSKKPPARVAHYRESLDRCTFASHRDPHVRGGGVSWWVMGGFPVGEKHST